jgi:hypothetical protein
MQLKLHSPRTLGLVAALALSPQALRGVEKYAIAADARLVAVANLSRVKKIPIAEGWRIEGWLVTDEILYGAAQRFQKLEYRFSCTCCPALPSPDLKPMTSRSGLWFLIPAGGRSWTSAGSCSDPGWRPIEERTVFEGFLKKRK